MPDKNITQLKPIPVRQEPPMNHNNAASLEEEFGKLTGDDFARTPIPANEVLYDVGTLTAQAIRADHDETIKVLNDVGEELCQVAKQCESYLLEVKDLMEYVKQRAEEIRARGKNISSNVEQSAKTTAEVRKSIGEQIDRIIAVPVLTK
jgi:methyl-accepting chemotaxis protein